MIYLTLAIISFLYLIETRRCWRLRQQIDRQRKTIELMIEQQESALRDARAREIREFGPG
jgi:hypothetical protein